LGNNGFPIRDNLRRWSSKSPHHTFLKVSLLRHEHDIPHHRLLLYHNVAQQLLFLYPLIEFLVLKKFIKKFTVPDTIIFLPIIDFFIHNVEKLFQSKSYSQKLFVILIIYIGMCTVRDILPIIYIAERILRISFPIQKKRFIYMNNIVVFLRHPNPHIPVFMKLHTGIKHTDLSKSFAFYHRRNDKAIFS